MESPVTNPQSYPYATHLNVQFPALSLVDVLSLVKACTDRWYNQTLCKVNDSVIRLGVMQGEYHWHKHDNDDEFFFVLEGRCRIRVGGAVHDLVPGDAVSRSAGTGVAHQFFNPYPAPCRVLMLGVMGGKGLTDETVYPELGRKVTVAAGGARKSAKVAAPKAVPAPKRKGRR